MMQATRELLERALKLDPAERAVLVAFCLAPAPDLDLSALEAIAA